MHFDLQTFIISKSSKCIPLSIVSNKRGSLGRIKAHLLQSELLYWDTICYFNREVTHTEHDSCREGWRYGGSASSAY
ncbi:unnamed protein product [Lactuca virosa]|uniref:Uncharacterized protein n=1 Tax=Lactuca virosa TaxID=75947 RepID=A0AAU9M619_9ASTR|nr:unnamed protein product [Lactuca virosa]